MDLVTQAERPELWASPSILLAAVSPNGSVLASAGWFTSVLSWEKRLPSDPRAVLVDDLTFQVAGNAALLDGQESLHQVQIEVALDGLEGSAIDDFLRRFVPKVILDALPALPSHDAVTVNANRDVEVPSAWAEIGASLIDVPVNTLPSTRGGSLPVIAATRWARVIQWRSGLLIVWRPASGYWDRGQVRWPHHAIPSREKEELSAMRDPTISVDQRMTGWFTAVVRHERYFLDMWTNELENWESQAFAVLAEGDEAYAEIDLPVLQRSLAVLAGYLDRARVSERFYLRRAHVSTLVAGNPELRGLFDKTHALLKTDLRHARESLRSAFELLNSVNQGAQSYAATESHRAQERLNSLITTVTAVLFVPSVIAAVYGANVQELSEGAEGSVSELLLLMFAFSLSSLGALAWGRLGRLTPLAGAALVLGTCLTFAVVLGHQSLSVAIAVAAGGAVLSGLLMVSMRLVPRFQRARSN